MPPLLVLVVGLTVVTTVAGFVALVSIPIRMSIAESRTRRGFAELARSLGAEPKGDAFTITVAGHRVKVSLFNPGKSEPLALRVAVPGRCRRRS